MKTTKIISKKVEDVVLESVQCDNCKRELMSVYNQLSDVSIDSFQFDDALHIKLCGGYGMYFDDRDYDFIFCKICSWALLEIYPIFKEITREFDKEIKHDT